MAKWLYKKTDGMIEGKLFEQDDSPPGWYDHPAKCTKPKRARVKGKFMADDKSTTDRNEAYE